MACEKQEAGNYLSLRFTSRYISNEHSSRKVEVVTFVGIVREYPGLWR